MLLLRGHARGILRRDGGSSDHLLAHLAHLCLAWLGPIVARSTLIGQVRDWSSSLPISIVHLVNLALIKNTCLWSTHHLCSLVHTLNIDQALHVSGSLSIDAKSLDPSKLPFALDSLWSSAILIHLVLEIIKHSIKVNSIELNWHLGICIL